MSNVKDIFKLEKGEPFYIGGEEYYKIKLVSKDQQDKQISFSYPYIFTHRLDNEGENLYVASESDGKIIKRHLPFHNNKEYSLKDFQSKMKLQELPSHFINVKVMEHEGKYKFALYDKVVSSSEDTEKFITILPLSSFSYFNRNFNISEYKDEELRLTLKKAPMMTMIKFTLLLLSKKAIKVKSVNCVTVISSFKKMVHCTHLNLKPIKTIMIIIGGINILTVISDMLP
ncbi:MAG: hypothetical protein ACEY3A_01375 [Wolbachia sp.]